MRSLIIAVATLVVVLVVALVAAPSPAAAIVGGSVSDAKSGGAAVLIIARGKGYTGQCSGVLVAARKVLTAAHCVRSPRGKALKVRSVRIGNPKGKTQRVRVSSIAVHPDYDPAKPERGSDLAVLHLAKDASATPIALAAADDEPGQGDKVVVRGFGLTRRGKRLRQSQGTLRTATLEWLSPFACFTGPVKEMAKTRACAANPEASLCPGDSGAGIVRALDDGEVVVGVTSIVLDGGSCKTGPAIMTRVSTFATWVEASEP